MMDDIIECFCIATDDNMDVAYSIWIREVGTIISYLKAPSLIAMKMYAYYF